MRRMAPEEQRSKAGFGLTNLHHEGRSRERSGLWTVERSSRRLELGMGFVRFLQDFLRFISGQAFFRCELEGLEP